MIEASKMKDALAAINAVLVAARTMAYAKRPPEELVEVLDVAEYLPSLLLDPVERSTEFREQLVFLATHYRAFGFGHAVHKFDRI